MRPCGCSRLAFLEDAGEPIGLQLIERQTRPRRRLLLGYSIPTRSEAYKYAAYDTLQELARVGN